MARTTRRRGPDDPTPAPAPTAAEPEPAGPVDEPARVPLATPPAKTVTLEATTSFNEHKVGDRWDAPLNETTLAFVDKGWVDVVGVDGFRLPTSL